MDEKTPDRMLFRVITIENANHFICISEAFFIVILFSSRLFNNSIFILGGYINASNFVNKKFEGDLRKKLNEQATWINFKLTTVIFQ